MTTTNVRDFRISSRIAEELELILCSVSDSRLSELWVAYVCAVSGGNRFEIGLTSGSGGEVFDAAEQALPRAEGFLRSELVRALNLKRAPSFQFVLVPEEVCDEK